MSVHADYQREIEEYQSRIADLEARIAAKDAALRFYADTNSWRTSTVYACGHYGETRASTDGGKIARAALAQPAPQEDKP